MKNILYSILAVVLVIGLVIIIKNHTSSTNDQKEIVIGAPLSLTGTAATDGLSIKRGIDLAVDDLAKQGVNVKVVYQDDATDPKQTISAINSIVATNSHVDALIGPTWSFLLDASASTIDSDKIVSYSPANTSEFIQSKSSYLFFGAIKNAYKVDATEQWLKDMNVHKVAIIVDKSAWGESVLAPYKIAAQNAGVSVVLADEVPFGAEADAYPTILAKMRSLGADGLLWTGYDEGGTILVQKMQEMGMNIPLLAASTVLSGLVENHIVSIRPQDKMYYLTTDISLEFSQKFFQTYGSYPKTYSDSAYDGVMLLVQATRNKPAEMTLDQYLKSPDFHYTGYQTDYSFDKNGDIKGGEWVVKQLGTSSASTSTSTIPR